MHRKNKIEPSYYSEGGIPVFEPTIEEFNNFTKYVKAILPYGLESSLAKVIPPKEWNGNQLNIEEKLNNIVIKNPIEQHLFGNRGVFKITNMERRKAYTVKQFEQLCYSESYKPPSPNSGVTNRLVPPSKKKKTKENKNVTSLINITPTSLNSKESSPSKLDIVINSAALENIASSPNSRNGMEERNKKKKKEKENLEDIVVPEYDQNMYTPEYLKEVERNYWRNITFIPPLYGADLSGSLFNEKIKVWNVGDLGDLLKKVDAKLPGVNDPYLYFGMWKATFAWHVEDMDLFSINYIHRGAPKQWYSIPQEHKARFERFMQSRFTQDHEKCSQFLRHKTFIVSPSVLADNYIPVKKITHLQGEFMITFPNGYHSGYNLGFNIAESVNFATEEWIELGRKAKKCECLDDTVCIDMSIFESFETNGSTKKKKNKKEEIIVATNSNINEKKNKIRTQKRKNQDKTKTKTIDEKPVIDDSIIKIEEEKQNLKKPRSSYLGNNEIRFSCILCRSLEGTLIHSKDKIIYAHPICAQFIEGTEVVNDLDGKQYLLGYPTSINDKKTKCYKCHRMGGSFVQCSESDCGRKFHVTCVNKKKLIFHLQSKKKQTFCSTHGPKVKPPAIEAPWSWPKFQGEENEDDKFQANLNFKSKISSIQDNPELEIIVD
ncbi:JmjC-domain-containing protein [Neoconidiobolus thromboides FSU 785]|nr:JmjC-domain-containing protein [Neoconidiobolus thromboides FSU 785]